MSDRAIHVLRHAKSSWDEPGMEDHERTLAPRGRKATPLIADHMKRHGFTPDVVLCSDSVRTRETLFLLGDVVPDTAEITITRDLYEASADQMLAMLQGLGDTTASVLLVGHNPSSQQLAVSLASGGERLDDVREKFPTAALATLSYAGPWEKLGPASCVLTDFVRPRELGSND